ncbi:MAG TPA: 4'-phosphopantetheinyl transferase superfamily protein [Bacteroidia bacterium]|nr:4'-phosphopantetheinyl transferase superfamily protein [Bacteroidia bacterium]
MPLKEHRRITENCQLGIWQVTEEEPELQAAMPLSSAERDVFDKFTHPYRRKQWLATRILLDKLMPGARIDYDVSGKPFTNYHGMHISLSHTGKLIALIADVDPCGIDIETLRPTISRIAHKFLSPVEMAAAQSGSASERMHIYWSVKEALYKVYGKKNVSLRTNIFVAAFDNVNKGHTRATLQHEHHFLEKQVNYEIANGYVLAWTNPVNAGGLRIEN